MEHEETSCQLLSPGMLVVLLNGGKLSHVKPHLDKDEVGTLAPKALILLPRELRTAEMICVAWSALTSCGSSE